MANMDIYLLFNGNCEQAFSFYETAIGATVAYRMRYGDMPDGNRVPASDKDRILHITLPIGNMMIMGSDAQSDHPVSTGTNVALTLYTDNAGEAERLFTGLSAGGKVTVPLGKTFFAELYAMFFDKFGVQWMVIFEGLKKSGA